jgi:hypothetical protein
MLFKLRVTINQLVIRAYKGVIEGWLLALTSSHSGANLEAAESIWHDRWNPEEV